MARPRKFLQREKDGRFFVQVTTGPRGRVHLGTKDKTEADSIGRYIVLPWYERKLPEVRRRVKLWAADATAVEPLDQQLTDFARGDYADEILDDPDIAHHVRGVKQVLKDYDEDNDSDRVPQDAAAEGICKLLDSGRSDLLTELLTVTVADQTVEPDVLRKLQRAIDKRLGSKSKIAATAQRLSDCIPVWRKRLEAKRIGENHIVAYENVYQKFIELCGDCYLSHLAKSHFVDWQDHVDESKGGRGAQWRKSQLIPVGAIIRKARKLTDWKFPIELDLWLSVFEYGKVKPHKSHRVPLWVEHFKAMLAKLEEWSTIDVQAYTDSLPNNRATDHLSKANNIKQAKRIQRFGMQWLAILRLAVNCGCDNSDISVITYDDLDLGAKLPVFKLTRKKTGVRRHTPLLPSTIAAINRWRESEVTRFKNVFTNDGKKPFVSAKVSNNFQRLRDAVGADGVWFKHCRNVGATLGRNHRLTINECEAFLGHDVNGMCVFYMGDTPDDYLVPLVNLIGAEYFGGETVGR